MSPSTISSADPELLDHYRRIDEAIDEAMIRRAGVLGDALARLAASRSEGVPDVAGLADQVRRGAVESLRLAAWVGQVATAFRRADHGAIAPPPGWNDPAAAALTDALAALAGATTPQARALVIGRFVAGGSVDVDSVATIAAQLSPQQLATLAHDHPELVGPVDGWPPTSRYEANRVLIVRAYLAATGDRRDRLGAFLGNDAATGRPRQFLLFDPTGDGRVAEVFGDLATATSVGVAVPGMGTSLDRFDTQVAPRARNLYDAAEARYPNRRFATIAWLGYDAPDNLPSDEVLSHRQATGGGVALARFVDGLDLAAEQRLTLVGHSYGTVVIGAALYDGVRAQNVLAMGSPGMGVADAADFDRDDSTQFFTMEAPGDLVTTTGWFGPDPNAPDSGFIRLETGGHGHSSYLTTAGRSVLNAAAVLADDDAGLHRRNDSPAEMGLAGLTVADGLLGTADHFLEQQGHRGGAGLPRAAASRAVQEVDKAVVEPAKAATDLATDVVRVLDPLDGVVRALSW